MCKLFSGLFYNGEQFGILLCANLLLVHMDSKCVHGSISLLGHKVHFEFEWISDQKNVFSVVAHVLYILKFQHLCELLI